MFYTCEARALQSFRYFHRPNDFDVFVGFLLLTAVYNKYVHYTYPPIYKSQTHTYCGKNRNFTAKGIIYL